MARIGIEVGLFDALSKAEGRAQSAAQLAEATKVDPALMRMACDERIYATKVNSGRPLPSILCLLRHDHAE